MLPERPLDVGVRLVMHGASIADVVALLVRQYETGRHAGFADGRARALADLKVRGRRPNLSEFELAAIHRDYQAGLQGRKRVPAGMIRDLMARYQCGRQTIINAGRGYKLARRE